MYVKNPVYNSFQLVVLSIKPLTTEITRSANGLNNVPIINFALSFIDYLALTPKSLDVKRGVNFAIAKVE